jgi:carbon monoxide dehydrogenase subunit G
MGQINSEKTLIASSDEKIFNFVSDFNNFEKLMPEQVTEWESTGDTCAFTVSGMGRLKLRITEKVPDNKVVIVPEAGTKIPFTFELLCMLEKVSDLETRAQFLFMHEMPVMISMMASRPLQNLVDVFARKLKEHCESPAF